MFNFQRVLEDKGVLTMTFVSLLGRVRESVDSTTRILEVSRPESSGDANNLHILCQYWTKDEHNMFTALKEGTLVVVRGRIDNDDKHGFIVVVEQVTVVK